MKVTIEQIEFVDRLQSLGDFSIEACEALYEWYEELENGLGEEIEFDPVAIRCEWNEYDDPSEAAEELLGEDYNADKALEALHEEFLALSLDDGKLLVLGG